MAEVTLRAQRLVRCGPCSVWFVLDRVSRLFLFWPADGSRAYTVMSTVRLFLTNDIIPVPRALFLAFRGHLENQVLANSSLMQAATLLMQVFGWRVREMRITSLGNIDWPLVFAWIARGLLPPDPHARARRAKLVLQPDGGAEDTMSACLTDFVREVNDEIDNQSFAFEREDVDMNVLKVGGY